MLLVCGPPAEDKGAGGQIGEQGSSAQASWCSYKVLTGWALLLSLLCRIQVLLAGSRNTWWWGHKFAQAPSCS